VKFVIDIPNDMLSWDEKEALTVDEIRRVLRSHIAHMGNVTIEPLLEGGPMHVIHMLTKIEARLSDKNYYLGLMCNCKEAEESQRGLYKKWTCCVHGEQNRCYE